jgi:hypothetical protein
MSSFTLLRLDIQQENVEIAAEEQPLRERKGEVPPLPPKGIARG